MTPATHPLVVVLFMQARICTPSKAAQLSDSPYLLGLDRNRLSMWDIRTQEGIVEWIDGREYGRGYNFKCLATSGEGHVVVGSADGKISLYKAGKLTKVSCTCCTAWLAELVTASLHNCLQPDSAHRCSYSVIGVIGLGAYEVSKCRLPTCV